MKTSVVLLTAASFAYAQVFSSAPAIPTSINECGHACIENIYSAAQFSLGCPILTAKCLCSRGDIFFNLRDCSIQCSPETAGRVLEWYGNTLCSAQQSFTIAPSSPGFSGPSFAGNNPVNVAPPSLSNGVNVAPPSLGSPNLQTGASGPAISGSGFQINN